MDMKRDEAYQDLNEEFFGPNVEEYEHIMAQMTEEDQENYEDKKQ